MIGALIGGFVGASLGSGGRRRTVYRTTEIIREVPVPKELPKPKPQLPCTLAEHNDPRVVNEYDDHFTDDRCAFLECRDCGHRWRVRVTRRAVLLARPGDDVPVITEPMQCECGLCAITPEGMLR